MLDLSESELLLWGGIIIMVISAALGIVFTIISYFIEKKLNHRLEQEYGERYQ